MAPNRTPRGTDISITLNNNRITNDNIIYDLQGRRVNPKQSPLKKGLYIVNEKKVIIQ